MPISYLGAFLPIKPCTLQFTLFLFSRYDIILLLKIYKNMGLMHCQVFPHLDSHDAESRNLEYFFLTNPKQDDFDSEVCPMLPCWEARVGKHVRT